MMKFLATLNPGVEEVAIREIEELVGAKANILHKGAVVFEAKEEAIFKLNFLARSLHRIILLLEHSTFEKLDDLYELTKKIDFTNYIYPTQTFAIRAERIGRHNFTSIDVARVTGQAVIDSYKESKGVRLKVNLDNPNIILRVQVYKDQFWIGLDTTGENSLHKRWYRKYKHPAPLKSTLAYSMIRLADFDPEKESLIDPCCGSGTIPIEAALWALDIPPSKNRTDFDFLKFFWLDKEKFLEMRRKHREKEMDLKIFGSDLNEKWVKIARKNAEEAGVQINFFKSDATQQQLNYDKIVVDLPFGVRTSSKGLEEFYKKFFENLRKWNWREVVCITTRPELIDMRTEREYEVDYGDLKAKILIFKK